MHFRADAMLLPSDRYWEGAVQLEKIAGPALSREDVNTLDAVLLSHESHLGDLDGSGHAVRPTAAVTFTTPAGAARLGGNAAGLTPFETRIREAEYSRRLFGTGACAKHRPVGIEPISRDVVGFLVWAE